jgi:hypothetical protein
MQKYARMGMIGGIVAVLALAAVAFAVASGDDNSPPVDDPAVQTTDGASPTAAAETDAPTGTPFDDEDDGDEPEENDDDREQPAGNEDEGDDEDGEDSGTTTALNPAGHCVELPSTSDVIQDPDQHDNWTIAECDPQNDGPDDGDDVDETPDAEEPDEDGDDDGDGQPAELIPATNPGGQCTQIAANSDVARHPEKHPGWTLGECGDDGEE